MGGVKFTLKPVKKKIFFEIECKKKSSGERVCYIEPRIKIGEREYSPGKMSCDELRPSRARKSKN